MDNPAEPFCGRWALVTGAGGGSRFVDCVRLLATNVLGPLLVTKRLLATLRAAHGQIVVVGSSAGLETRAGIAASAASQHAPRALADAFRAEPKPDGVRVLSMKPGRTETPMPRRIFGEEGRVLVPERLLLPAGIAPSSSSRSRSPFGEVTEVRIRSLVKP